MTTALHPIGGHLADALTGSGASAAPEPRRWPAAQRAVAAALAGPQSRAAVEAISVLVGLLLEEGATRAAHAIVAAVRDALPDAASEATVARYRAFGGAPSDRAAPARAPSPGAIPAHRLTPPRKLR